MGGPVTSAASARELPHVGGAWIVYRSSAAVAPTAQMLLDIIRAADRNNAADGVSGMLAYDGGGAFAQLLEGPAQGLRRRFAAIAGDDRHVVRWWRGGALSGRPLTLGLPMGYIDLDVEGLGESQALRDAGPDDALALAQRLRLLARAKYPRAVGGGMSQA